MIDLQQRKEILVLLDEAKTSGARQVKACEIIGISEKTIQRWKSKKSLEHDGRKNRDLIPVNKLSEAERNQILEAANSKEFCAMTPNQIVPILAERGEYIASERTFYRVLSEEGQLQHRQASQPGAKRYKPEAVCATGPGQLLSWDITYLKTTVMGQFFYLYLFMDIFSRKIVGWRIHDRESSHLAAEIVQDIAIQEGIEEGQTTIHSDNGSPMKGATILSLFQWLGITPSFSRPAVSNDNPYSESLFKTLKYCPYYPSKPFENLSEARQWMEKFVDWYNHHHHHSGINYVTPAQRHAGLDKAILEQRNQTYTLAKAKHPERWSRQPKYWKYQESVFLNPDKKTEMGKVEELKLAS